MRELFSMLYCSVFKMNVRTMITHSSLHEFRTLHQILLPSTETGDES